MDDDAGLGTARIERPNALETAVPGLQRFEDGFGVRRTLVIGQVHGTSKLGHHGRVRSTEFSAVGLERHGIGTSVVFYSNTSGRASSSRRYRS